MGTFHVFAKSCLDCAVCEENKAINISTESEKKCYNYETDNVFRSWK